MGSPSDFELFAMHTVRRTPDYMIEFDHYRRPSDEAEMFLSHIRVYRWAASVLKSIRKDVADYRAIVPFDVYAAPPPEDTPLWRKFVEAVGFEYHSHIACIDGIARPLYILRKLPDVVLSNDQFKQLQHQQ